ncbi:hypothetical protein FVE85_1821 [Porphyridium purpureum]|uniref:Uncharacterized protein n=1 Tax=Porphyridium purpureum TaxID=35688 RepID=A0A5J4YWF9_PORPP|nr:hypothetical protein FVE85_1821 [Porphyridium purpureum]|eukprot:POR0799..scf209_3
MEASVAATTALRATAKLDKDSEVRQFEAVWKALREPGDEAESAGGTARPRSRDWFEYERLSAFVSLHGDGLKVMRRETEEKENTNCDASAKTTPASLLAHDSLGMNAESPPGRMTASAGKGTRKRSRSQTKDTTTAVAPSRPSKTIGVAGSPQKKSGSEQRVELDQRGCTSDANCV